jgi:CARDB
VRRAVGLTALVIVVILAAVGIHSCQVSQAHSALRNYDDSVTTLIHNSNQNGSQFFKLLSSGLNSNNAPSLQTQIDQARRTADNQLQQAKNLSVPGELTGAQQDLVLALQMRRDGIANVGRQLQSALQSSTAPAALASIAAEMARLYASDAVYKDYTLPSIESALRSNGITVGGPNGQPVASGQFLPDIQWLQPTFVASQLHVSAPASTNSTTKPAPGSHGHALDSCSAGGTTLDTASATTIPASAAASLNCTVTNDGQNTETNVVVKASVSGTSVTGQGVIPQTQPGQQYTVQVPLSSAPPAGTYDLVVTVEHVPGETTFTHNTKTFPVTFG